MACIILGISASIAAYKAADLASALVKLGHEVHCVCTRRALEFVTPLVLQTLSRNPVLVDLEDEKHNWVPMHIELAKKADLLVVAPATANTIANFAHGLAPDALSCIYLATRAPLLVCPAMNTHMWQHARTRRNMQSLLELGAHMVEPQQSGVLACGDEGPGKLAELDQIISAITRMLTERDRQQA